MNSETHSQEINNPDVELTNYCMPTLDLLKDYTCDINGVDQVELEENKARISQVLNDYHIPFEKIETKIGPTITLYEITPSKGARIKCISRLEDDIAMSMAIYSARVISPMPGRGTIGIEIPNKSPQLVSIRSILGSKAYQECNYELPIAIGSNYANDPYIFDLAKTPHLLVAGATGQGVSLTIDVIISSLLYKRLPSELKFVLIDSSLVQFCQYAQLEKHYLAKLPNEEEAIVTDSNKAIDTLNSLCIEMDSRYSLLKESGCRSVMEYNNKFINRHLNPEKGHRHMPYIVTIIYKFTDLIMMAGESVQRMITRIAQKARAVGMHMIIATQRPSTNVITGILKANFPGRIGFRVSQMVDSRTILDAPGANQLIGRGDMLISTCCDLERVQCAYIGYEETEAICNHIGEQKGFDQAYILTKPLSNTINQLKFDDLRVEKDVLFEEIARWSLEKGAISISDIQRTFCVGFNRGRRIMTQLNVAGIISSERVGHLHIVLVDSIQLEKILERL